MRRSKCAIALIAAASVLAFAGAGLAANPGQADFDACNKEAQAKGGSPAASPGTKDSGAATSASPGTSSAPSASPSTSGGASSTTSGGAAAGAGTSGTTGGTSVSGGASTSAEAQLQGMAAAGQADPAYQQVYRDCMKKRGF